MNIQGKWLVLLAVVFALLAAGGARADNPDANARFYGGARDGYDRGALNLSGLEWAEFQSLLAARGRGGSRDGYAMAAGSDLRLQPGGSVFMFR